MPTIDIDTRHGMQEGTSPEASDFTKGLAYLEGRYQPTVGLWERFPGFTTINSDLADASPGAAGRTLSLVKTRNGFAHIIGHAADEADWKHELVQYNPTSDTGRMREYYSTPAYSIRHHQIASQQFNRYVGGTGVMYAYAANTDLDAVVTTELKDTSSTDYFVRVSVFDRNTGVSVYTRQIMSDAAGTGNYIHATITGVTATFNGNLLWIAISAGATPNGQILVFRCEPRLGTGSTDRYLLVVDDSKIHTSCPQPGGTGFYMLGTRLAANFLYVARIADGSPLTVADSATKGNFTNTVVPGMDTANGNSGYVWVAGRFTGTGELQILGLELAALGTNTYNQVAAGVVLATTEEVYLGAGGGGSNNELRIALYASAALPLAGTAVYGTTRIYRSVTGVAPATTVDVRTGFNNWHPVSDPHYCNVFGTTTNGTWSLQLSDDTFPCSGSAYGTNVPVAQNVLVNLNENGALQVSSGVSQYVTPPIANVESFLSFRNGAVRDHIGKLVTGTYGIHGAFSALLNANSMALVGYRVDRMTGLTSTSAPNYATDTVHTSADSAGGSTLVSAAAPFLIDGSGTIEPALYGRPGLAVEAGGAGTLAAGTRKYVAVYRASDSYGNTIFSRISEIFSFTNGVNVDNSVRVSFPSISMSYPDTLYTPILTHASISVDIYRTADGGTVYRLAHSVGKWANSPTYTVTDSLSDANLASRPKLYRQPGTQGTALERWNWQPGGHVCANRDRLFWIGPDGYTIFYTGFYVYGESPWCSPAYRIEMQRNYGKAVALASMDDRLIVLAENGAFVIDGDGPPENGGNGTEFTQPRLISSSFGCIAARSVQVTPIGLFYRSNRGVELLDRGLSNKFIGEPIEETMRSYHTTTDSCFDQQTGCYFLFAGTTDGAGGNIAAAYQVDSNTWSIRKRGTSGFFRCCVANLYTEGSRAERKSVMVVAGPNSASASIVRQNYPSESAKTDISSFVPTTFETHWIRTAGQSGRQRVKDFFYLGRKLGNHKITISAAYNYSSSYTQSASWEPGVINAATIEHLALQPNKDQEVSIRFKVVEAAPTDTGTYPITDGLGSEAFGLSLNVEPIKGEFKLPAAQKG